MIRRRVGEAFVSTVLRPQGLKPRRAGGEGIGAFICGPGIETSGGNPSFLSVDPKSGAYRITATTWT
jgi:hypothetical protein